MTPLKTVYDAFLAQVNDDEWLTWTEWEQMADWKQLLMAAISWFKFPRISLEISTSDDDDNFVNTIGNSEIQVLVAYMKAVWLERIVLSYENLRPLYAERDFSPANMLNQFEKKQESQMKAAKALESAYYRSIEGKPYDYKRWAGSN